MQNLKTDDKPIFWLWNFLKQRTLKSISHFILVLVHLSGS